MSGALLSEARKLERRLQAAAAGHTALSRNTPSEMLAPANAAKAAALELEVDPHHELPKRERDRRVAHLRQAQMLSLARKSVKARRLIAETAINAQEHGVVADGV